MPMKVLLLDIEGTTTPIAFVHDVLFPYARAHVAEFLRAHFDDDAVEADRAAIGAEEGVDPDNLDELIAAIHRQIDADKKSTPLKSLQGKIWRAGYADGSLRSQVFDDVPEVLRDAHAAGVRICIYSSGSVEAQRLLFAHTNAGNLCPLLGAYFDTTTGPKKDSRSYHTIARALGVAEEEILFATDSLDEARAAEQAGVRAALVSRAGNAPIEVSDLPTWTSLDPVREVLKASG